MSTPDAGSLLDMASPPRTASKEISNKTPLARTTGKVQLDCPICALSFERYACWAKRHKINYCSKACADEAKRRPIECTCVVCGGIFISTPAEVSRKRIVTCSDRCMRLRRSNLTKEGVLLKQGTFQYASNTRGKGFGRLSPDDVSKILQDGRTRRAIADDFGIHIETVTLLRRQHRRAEATPSADEPRS